MDDINDKNNIISADDAKNANCYCDACCCDGAKDAGGKACDDAGCDFNEKRPYMCDHCDAIHDFEESDACCCCEVDPLESLSPEDLEEVLGKPLTEEEAMRLADEVPRMTDAEIEEAAFAAQAAEAAEEGIEYAALHYDELSDHDKCMMGVTDDYLKALGEKLKDPEYFAACSVLCDACYPDNDYASSCTYSTDAIYDVGDLGGGTVYTVDFDAVSASSTAEPMSVSYVYYGPAAGDGEKGGGE